jgi:CheY-like chemotaxis protein
MTMPSGRLLIVDPDRRAALDLQQRVTPLGYTVLALATSAQEALALAEALRPDGVLMEVRLPGPLDSFRAGTQIWMRLGIPVIYVSAHLTAHTLQRLWPTAMAGLLGKDTAGRDLRNALAEALDARPAAPPLWSSTRDGGRPHLPPAVIEPHREGFSEGQRPAAEGRPLQMPLRMLLVEDERIIAADLRRRLRRMGHTVVGTAASAEEAVAHAHRRQPDLVLMDIRLRGRMDGIEAAERIRARRWSRPWRTVGGRTRARRDAVRSGGGSQGWPTTLLSTFRCCLHAYHVAQWDARHHFPADELLAQPFGQVAPVDRATPTGAQPRAVDSLLSRLLRSERGEVSLGGGKISGIIVPRLALASGHLHLGRQWCRRLGESGQ